MVNVIGTFENGTKSVASYDIANEQIILSLGSNLLEIVKEMNNSLTGILVNTYITCLIVATGTLYSSSTILFEKSLELR